MSLAYDWSPAFGALNNLIQQQVQKKQYEQALSGMFGQGQMADNPVAVTPAANAQGADQARAMAQAHNAQPFMTGGGPLAAQAGRMLPLLQGLPPEMGMPLLMKTALTSMQPEEYDPTPRSGINPATGKRGQFLVGKQTGAIHWLDAPPETKVEFQNGVAVDPYSTAPGTVINDPNEPFAPTGAANKPYQDFALAERRAGRPLTNVNVTADRSFGTQLGENAGKILDASHSAALGGLQTIDTANSIRAALDSGKVTAGPGATFVQTFNQITGGDQDKLVKTRETIQGLAKLTLAARGALKGQGQISDYEGKLLAKASSGDIDSMTVPEIRAIANVADRAARFSIRQNKANVDKARVAAPGNQSLVDFYNVDEPAAYSNPNVSAPKGVDPNIWSHMTPEEKSLWTK